MSDDAARLATRLRRLETQIRAFRELHSQELQLILDELTDVLTSVEGLTAAEQSDASVDATPDGAGAADPAASSPKRATWLAEQERRAQLSRRELLRGRET